MPVAAIHTSARPPFHVMTKPIGPICNLDCKYCFYLEKESLYQDNSRPSGPPILGGVRPPTPNSGGEGVFMPESDLPRQGGYQEERRERPSWQMPDDVLES